VDDQPLRPTMLDLDKDVHEMLKDNADSVYIIKQNKRSKQRKRLLFNSYLPNFNRVKEL
jgi:hypothetical protein